MSVNRYLPHLLVFPEDDANRQLANGFHLQVDSIRQRQMQVLPVAGGWNEVLDRFRLEHLPEMERYSQRYMILLIDCDGDKDRLESAKAAVPPSLLARTFVLGALTEPEALKPDLGTYEKIGSEIASDCRSGTSKTWGHRLLEHNLAEVDRLQEIVSSILFAAN